MSIAATEFPHFLNARLKWQTFGVTSLILMGLFVVSWLYTSQSSNAQFEDSRHVAYTQHKQQFDLLIEGEAKTLIQLASAVTTSQVLSDAIITDDKAVINRELDQLSWRLQVDAGVENVALFNEYGQPIASNSSVASNNLVKKVLDGEVSLWQVSCLTSCSIETATALLFEGDVIGVALLSEPLSNVMLHFQQLANIDTGLLGKQRNNQEISPVIPSWDKSVQALTNPLLNQSIISQASRQFSLNDLKLGQRWIDENNQMFELRAIPIQDRQMLLITNVSQDYTQMQAKKMDAMRVSLYALAGAELLLLLLLWRPLSGSSKTIDNAFMRMESELGIKAASLVQAERFSALLWDNVQAMMLVIDDQGRIQKCNNQSLRTMGLASSEMKGHYLADLFDADVSASFAKERIQDVLDGHLTEYQHQANILIQGGGKLNVQWHYVPLYDDVEGGRRLLVMARPLCILHSSF